MFDTVAPAGRPTDRAVAHAVADDAVACADALAASVVEERAVVARRFALVAWWADQHCPTEESEADLARLSQGERIAARDRGVVGADGTPRVTRAGVVELGVLLGTSTGSAQALVRDVLELRHRLPAHWAAVQALEVDGWKARQVAVATHALSVDRARRVDTQVLTAVTGLAWGRAKDVVEGTVIAADPAAHARRAAEEEYRRFVSTHRRSNAAGLRTLVARGLPGDIARIEAMVAHLAALLVAAGDTRHVDYRRATALAMLADPAGACLFLAEAHQRRTGPEGEAHEDQDDLRAEPEPVTPSAVELAVAFGQALAGLGATVVDRLRPRSVLYVHLSAEAVAGLPGCGVARVEEPLAGGPVSLAQLRMMLGHDRITVRPVLDPSDTQPVDCYEIPTGLRRALRLLTPFETFPYGTTPTPAADLDHPIPYRPTTDGGPPGQTGLHNLGPLGRRHHLAKTFDGFTVHQPLPGLYLWRTPTGHWHQVDHRGTRPLGRHPGRAGPPLLDLTQRLPTTGMSMSERRFRDTLVRHAAA